MLLEPIKFLSDEEVLYEMNTINHLTRPTLISVHLADIHFGAIDVEEQYRLLKEQVLDVIYNLPIDIISLNGDLFDHKFMSNSDVILYANKFINDLVNICREKNITLVIIHGTLLHDANQLKLFYHYLADKTVDIRIVEQVKFEYIKAMKVLCIPELYGQPKEYYDECLFNSGVYDEVFMHGTLQGAIFGTMDSEKHSDKAPIFTMEDFCMCSGPIISGHVHNPNCLKQHFYYCGSPYTWKHGEADKKGFLINIHNLETHEYYIHFQEIQGFRFVTVELDSMIDDDPKNVIEYINQLKNQGIYSLRVLFNTEPNDIQASNLQIIKTYYRNSPDISIKTIDRKKQQIEKVNQELSEKYKQYEFINDKSLDEFEKLSRYINIRKDEVYVTADEIKEFFEKEI